jgi:RNA polymerase sigma-70 factor (ECF subfamily)
MTKDTQKRVRQEQEIRELVDELTPQGLTIAVRMLGSREEGEEAVQDALIRLLRQLGRFREESRLSTWFCRITVNECKRRLARRRPRTVPIEEIPESGLQAPEGGLLQTLEQAEQRRIIERAIAHLSAIQRTAIVLYYLKEYSCIEVGKVLKLDRKIVAVYVFRARKTLGPLFRKGELMP